MILLRSRAHGVDMNRDREVLYWKYFDLVEN
eukprot:bmy_19522T0